MQALEVLEDYSPCMRRGLVMAQAKTSWESSLGKLRQEVADNIRLRKEAASVARRAMATQQQEAAAFRAQKQASAAKVAALEGEVAGAAELRREHAQLSKTLADTERQLAEAQVRGMPHLTFSCIPCKRMRCTAI